MTLRSTSSSRWRIAGLAAFVVGGACESEPAIGPEPAAAGGAASSSAGSPGMVAGGAAEGGGRPDAGAGGNNGGSSSLGGSVGTGGMGGGALGGAPGGNGGAGAAGEGATGGAPAGGASGSGGGAGSTVCASPLTICRGLCLDPKDPVCTNGPPTFAQLTGGSFGLPLDLSSNAASCSFAELTGDDKIDVLFGTRGQGAEQYLSVLPGIGDGNFGGPVTAVSKTESPFRLVRTRDLDADGHADVIALTMMADHLTSALFVARSDGKGGFAPLPLMPTVGFAQDVAFLDWNEDGMLDVAILISDAPTSVRLFAGDGKGSFELKTSIVLDGPSLLIEAGDFDGDGRQDLVLGPGGLPQRFVRWLSSKDGWQTVAQGASEIIPPCDQYTPTVDTTGQNIADIDGDGFQDFLIETSVPSVLLFRGSSTGLLSPEVVWQSSNKQDEFRLPTFLDWIGDGRLGVIGHDGKAMRLLPGDGKGAIGTPIVVDSLDALGASFRLVGDLNGDGRKDLGGCSFVGVGTALNTTKK